MKTPQQLLQQTLEVGECLLPDASPGGRTPYPTVFVHGLLGWGARDALYRAVPYWGLAAGDVLGYLNACGYAPPGRSGSAPAPRRRRLRR